MSAMNRRVFLRGMALGGGLGLGLGLEMIKIPLAKAAPNSGHKFVFVYFDGGWDVLMSLDARDPGNLPAGIQLLWDSRQAEVRYRSVTATDRFDAGGRPVFLGPCMTEMIRHLDVSAILRGVVTDTVSHAVGSTYWSTGRFPLGEVPRGP